MGYVKHCKEKVEKQGLRCTFSGMYNCYIIDPVHIIRRSYSKALRDDKRNIIPGDREIHNIFDNGRFADVLRRYPWRCKAILHRMRDMDLYYFRRFCRRNDIEIDQNYCVII